MRISDVLFAALIFAGGVVTGVFLREADVVTGDHIRRAGKKTVDKVRSMGKPDPAESKN
jgi:hypothetical protein